MSIKKISTVGALAVIALSLVGPSVLAAEVGQESKVNSNGLVQFGQGRDTDPEGNDGPLRIEKVSHLNFGVVNIKGDTQTYNAIYQDDLKEETLDEHGAVVKTEYLPMMIRTADDRGSNNGWQLQVFQSREFSELAADGVTVKPSGSVLTGATINFNATKVERPIDKQAESSAVAPTLLHTNVVLNGTPQTLVSASDNQGMGTWQTLLGEKVSSTTQTVNDKDGKPTQIPVENDQVQLTVPGDVAKVKDALYQAELTWLLINTPEI